MPNDSKALIDCSGTCYGISAAFGRINIQVFTPIQKHLRRSDVYTQWITELTRVLFRWTFIIAAIYGILGTLLTYLFVLDMTSLMRMQVLWNIWKERDGVVVGEDMM